jgi:hypothetical protein
VGASHITGPTNNIHSTLGRSFVSTYYVLVLFISPGEYSYVAISSHAHLTFGTEPGAAQTITTTFHVAYIPGSNSTKSNPLAIFSKIRALDGVFTKHNGSQADRAPDDDDTQCVQITVLHELRALIRRTAKIVRLEQVQVGGWGRGGTEKVEG